METPKRQILPPHKPPADAEEYLAACTTEERRLVELAIKLLGSSYFMEKSHGYGAWKARQPNRGVDILNGQSASK